MHRLAHHSSTTVLANTRRYFSFRAASVLLAKNDMTQSPAHVRKPMDEASLKSLRSLRVLKRDRVDKSTGVSSNVFFQVVGSGNARSLFLYTDHNRYLFNCSEGTQRLITSQCPPRALAQLTNIFFTSKSWRSMGGFPGMCLTIRASGAPDVKVHGPEGSMALFESVKHFILLYEFDVISHGVCDGHFRDHNITVEQIQLDCSGPPVFPAEPKYGQWLPERPGRDTSRIRLEFEHDGVSKAKQGFYKSKPIEQTVLAYLITVKPKPGRLLIDKCVAMQVPPGPLLGELKAGRDIVLEGGVVVKSLDVMGDASPPLRNLVIECPNEHFLESLLQNPKLNDELFNIEDSSPLLYAFHFTPDAVVKSKKYQTWLQRFADSTVHVFLNEQNSDFSSPDVLIFTKKLHMIAPHLFPSLWDQNTGPPKDEIAVVTPKSGTRYHLRPEKCTDMADVKQYDEKALLEEVNSIDRVTELISQARDNMTPDTSCPEFPKITFLGTGSSIPNKYRCVSAILAQIDPTTYFLMDCGEGTLLQMRRYFGNDQLMDVLRNLKAVYVSHLHADHHLGLINIVQARTLAFKSIDQEVEKLLVLAPGKIEHFLSFYNQEFEPILEDAEHIRNEHLLLSPVPGSNVKSQLLYPHIMKDVLARLGLRSVATCRALHCPHSFCLSFVTTAGFKVVYTGDTRPTAALVNLGRHEQAPDLLIHEATMEQDMLDDAIKKKHSTFTEAVQEGKAMEAKFTMLTHFSQRYSKVPLFDEFEHDDKVGIAFDNLSVNPQTVKHVRFMFPVLAKMFTEEMDLIRERKTKLLQRDAYVKDMRDIFDDGDEAPPESMVNAKKSKIEKNSFL